MIKLNYKLEFFKIRIYYFGIYEGKFTRKVVEKEKP